MDKTLKASSVRSHHISACGPNTQTVLHFWVEVWIIQHATISKTLNQYEALTLQKIPFYRQAKLLLKRNTLKNCQNLHIQNTSSALQRSILMTLTTYLNVSVLRRKSQTK